MGPLDDGTVKLFALVSINCPTVLLSHRPTALQPKVFPHDRSPRPH